jgi:hypothetical protein
MDEKGAVAVHHDCKTSDDSHWVQFLIGYCLRDELFQGGEEFWIGLSGGRGGEFLFEFFNASRIDVFGSRQGHRFDGVPGGSIDLSEKSSLFGGYKDDCVAFSPCTARASDSVHVSF